MTTDCTHELALTDFTAGPNGQPNIAHLHCTIDGCNHTRDIKTQQTRAELEAQATDA